MHCMVHLGANIMCEENEPPIVTYKSTRKIADDDKVVDLEEFRRQREGKWSLASRVLCFDCGYEWVGILPEEARGIGLECPECGEFEGVIMTWE